MERLVIKADIKVSSSFRFSSSLTLTFDLVCDLRCKSSNAFHGFHTQNRLPALSHA